MNKIIFLIVIAISLSVLLMAAVPAPIIRLEQPDKDPQYIVNYHNSNNHFVNKIVYFNPETLVYESPKLKVNASVTAVVSSIPRNQIKSGYFKPCSTCSTTYHWAVVEVMVPPPGKCRWTYTYDH